ncbi:MAG: SPOR domain-containing protein [Bacteroidales bacterium]|nr:SPOR domain-containing protein [Bacteroidales bacterium]
MRVEYLTLLILFLSPNLFGQSYHRPNDPFSSLQADSIYRNHSVIKVDFGINENYYKHLIYNSNNPEVMGFRIRIFSGSGHNAKQDANRARSRFLSRYPEIGAYLNYDAPDYKVYVGDCRTRSEVLKLFNQIKRDFPYAFIPPKQAIDLGKYKSLN